MKDKLINTLLKTKQAANMLNMHVNTVRRLANKGLLSCFRINNRGDRRFHRNDVESLKKVNAPTMNR
jgi:excisionase family DNA binding protein